MGGDVWTQLQETLADSISVSVSFFAIKCVVIFLLTG